MQERYRRGKVVLKTELLDMVAPRGGVAFAHHEDVLHHLVLSKVRIRPDIVEDCQCVDV